MSPVDEKTYREEQEKKLDTCIVTLFSYASYFTVQIIMKEDYETRFYAYHHALNQRTNSERFTPPKKSNMSEVAKYSQPWTSAAGIDKFFFSVEILSAEDKCIGIIRNNPSRSDSRSTFQRMVDYIFCD